VVKVHVTDPDGVVVGNFTMSYDASSGLYYYERSYTTIDDDVPYDFTIWASDPSNNWASESSTFSVKTSLLQASIIVTVTSGGEPLDGVLLKLFDEDNTLVAETSISALGLYALTGIPLDATYTLKATKSGYKDKEVEVEVDEFSEYVTIEMESEDMLWIWLLIIIIIVIVVIVALLLLLRARKAPVEPAEPAKLEEEVPVEEPVEGEAPLEEVTEEPVVEGEEPAAPEAEEIPKETEGAETPPPTP